MNQDTPSNPEPLAGHAGYLLVLAQGLVRDRGWPRTWSSRGGDGRSRGLPRSGIALAGWLRTVIRNLAANRWRKGVRRDRRERAVARPESLESADLVVERHEVPERVAASLHALPEPYQETRHHRCFRDLTSTQIANRLHLPPTTVRPRLQRGLEKLRERLDREHGGGRRTWALALIPLLERPPSCRRRPTGRPPTPRVKRLTISLPGLRLHPVLSIGGIVVEAGMIVRDPRASGDRPAPRTQREIQHPRLRSHLCQGLCGTA